MKGRRDRRTKPSSLRLHPHPSTLIPEWPGCSFTQGPGNIVYTSGSGGGCGKAGNAGGEAGGVFRFSTSRSDKSPFSFIKSSDEERAEVDIPELVVNEVQADATAHQGGGDRNVGSSPLDRAIAVDAAHLVG